MTKNFNVSVPLRGCGFEMAFSNTADFVQRNCFRPLAGM